MIERLQERRQQEGGFTLVELLVVIVILGILAAIVVFAVGGITDRGTQKAKDTDTSVLRTAEEAAFAQSNPGVYQSESQLVTNKFLRTASTNNDICLPSATDHSDYVVVDRGAACSTAGASYTSWQKN